MRLPTADPQVICCGVAGGAVLLSTEQEVYYGLNTVGAYVWEHLPPVCQTVEQLSAALSALHPDVPVESIRADIQELLDALGAHGLVHSPVGAPTCDDSVAPQRLLEARGFPGSAVRVGARVDRGHFTAHAWVEYAGHVLGDRDWHVQRFTPLAPIEVKQPS